MRITATAVMALLAFAPAAFAEDLPPPIEPETLGVEATIKPGPNVFVIDQNWSGAGKVAVLDANDFSAKGNLAAGLVHEAVLSADAKTIYIASAYASRITWGPTENFIHVYDVETLTLKKEIPVVARMAQAEPQPALLSLVDDGKYLLLQNATPATSVTVVDLEKGEQIAEIPTPGCWGALPAPTGAGFVTVCGDGSMKYHGFSADGTFADAVVGADIFDPEGDAVFTNPGFTTDGYLFATFTGNLINVTLKDGVPTLASKFSIVGDEAWAPSGSEVIGYNIPTDTAFVLMHSDPYDGSHKDASEEIWAVDVSEQKTLYRSKSNAENSIAVTNDDIPVIYGGNDDNVLTRYEVDPEAKFAAKIVEEAEGMARNVGLILTEK